MTSERRLLLRVPLVLLLAVFTLLSPVGPAIAGHPAAPAHPVPAAAGTAADRPAEPDTHPGVLGLPERLQIVGRGSTAPIVPAAPVATSAVGTTAAAPRVPQLPEPADLTAAERQFTNSWSGRAPPHVG